MTTFILKKYKEPEQTTPEQTPDTDNADSPTNEKPNEEKITIKVQGSVAEIVAKALYKALGNEAEIQEKKDELEQEGASVKAISTEEINTDPVSALRSVNKDDIVYIQNKGFHTAKEDWFLMSVQNKTSNVFYSVESLIKYVVSRLKSA